MISGDFSVAMGRATTMGYSTTPGICWTTLSDRASRAMTYVGMTRGRDENHFAIYPAVTNEAHQHRHGVALSVARPWR
jgi:hypothetical protein